MTTVPARPVPLGRNRWPLSPCPNVTASDTGPSVLPSLCWERAGERVVATMLAHVRRQGRAGHGRRQRHRPGSRPTTDRRASKRSYRRCSQSRGGRPRDRRLWRERRRLRRGTGGPPGGGGRGPLRPAGLFVNCAGKAAFVPVAELSLYDWQSTLDAHLTGTFLCCRAAIDHLLVAKGRIVNTSSTYAYKGRPGGSIYSAVKAGIVGLTKVLAHELAPDVNVNAIAPGPIDTPLWRHGFEGDAMEARIAQ